MPPHPNEAINERVSEAIRKISTSSMGRHEAEQGTLVPHQLPTGAAMDMDGGSQVARRRKERWSSKTGSALD